MVCLAALLAGCAGFAPADGAPEREPYTVEEPLEPSLESEERAGERSQPGLSEDGVVDETAFVAAHERAHQSEPYVTRSAGTLAAENGSEVGWYDQRATFGAGDDPVSIVTQAGADSAAASEYLDGAVTDDIALADLAVRETWIDDGDVTDRQQLRNGTVVYGTQAPQRLTTTGTAAARALVQAENVSVAEGENDHVLSTEEAPPVFPSEPTGTVSIELAVREDGLIRWAELRGRLDGDGEPVTYTQRLEYETDVQRVESPSWLEEAEDRLEARNAEETSD